MGARKPRHCRISTSERRPKSSSGSSSRGTLPVALIFRTSESLPRLDAVSCFRRFTGLIFTAKILPTFKQFEFRKSRAFTHNGGQLGQPTEAVFSNARSQPLIRDDVQYILTRHVKTAREKCPSLKSKRVSPHVLRHSAAMDLLQNGVGRSVIALWLGDESMNSTQVYLNASLELKEKALAKTTPFASEPRRYRPSDSPKSLRNRLFLTLIFGIIRRAIAHNFWERL